MMLKYVGEDGKKGLKTGETYKCYVMTINDKPVVGAELPGRTMLYFCESIKEILENWQEVL